METLQFGVGDNHLDRSQATTIHADPRQIEESPPSEVVYILTIVTPQHQV
jgi:hypothetical protein